MLGTCRLYSELPEPLNDGRLTHPKQIRQKATAENIQLSENESKVYGAMQGMFNAKPDLVITIDNILLVCEAKLTESFDEGQLRRTSNMQKFGQPYFTTTLVFPPRQSFLFSNWVQRR